MTCPRCQAKNRDGARFCRECGATFAVVCPGCGAGVEAGSKFCDRCGAALAATPAQPAPAPRFASPESYTPTHLAEKILTSKSALEGERKVVTVLFADLKGSMELLADRDPEDARQLLDPVLERMMEAVHHYEGTVNQVMGDGIMALFGAPIGHEDHAVRACYAALRMQRRVTLYADEIQRAGGTPVQIRVGLNSGEVVVRAIGSDLHMDYTAVGQTTHLAARMEQMAKPGSVLVTGDTVRLAEGYVQVRPLGAVPVKGLETPTPVYEVTGTLAARSRFQASAARGLTRFVGRDRELGQLAQALERAAAGHGQAVAIVGEAGVGKSRLVWEFTRSHRTHGWLVLESGSVSYGKATPYLPVIDLLKAYCRIQERDDPRAIRERMAGKLLTLDRALEPLLTPLLALLDVPVQDATWDALDPPQRRQRTLEAVKRLLLREGQVQPVLVVFEDLHWIDAETQALLDGLIESLPTARLLLLVNYRPEYQHAWGGKTYYLQLRIDPLPPESAEELLHALLGEDRTLAPLTRMLIERTEGNPFFLEESVQTLVETRVLVGQRGAYRLVRTPEALQIPATAQAILAARIDRLPPEEKRLLQAAAVIGKDVPFPAPAGDRRAARGRACARGSDTSRGRSSSTRRACFRTSSTPSSTRSPTRSPTGACFRSVGACCTPGSSMPSRRSTASAYPSRSSASRTTPSAARRGRRPWGTCARRAPRPMAAPRIARPPNSSSRRCTPSSTCRAAGSGPNTPSTFGWSFGRRSFHLATRIRSWSTSPRPTGWPRRSATLCASLGLTAAWATTAGGPANRIMRSLISSGPWRHSTAWNTIRVPRGSSPWVRRTTRSVTIAGPSSR